MNQSDFAKLHGVSRKTVTTWKARGWLVLVDDDIDVKASNFNLERFRKTVTQIDKKATGNTQGNKTGNTLGNRSKGNKSGNTSAKNSIDSPAEVVKQIIAENGVEMSIDEARQMKENYLALLTRLEYDIKSGQVLPYNEMIEAVGREYSRMRTRLIALAPEQGPRLRMLASTTNDAEFVTALQEVVYEAMEALGLDNNNNGENG